MHVKRQKISRLWKIPMKGTKYLIVPSQNKKHGVPLLIILRDLLKLAKNRREARNILLQELVSVNGKVRKRENYSVLPFESVQIKDKNYELAFSNNGKFEVQESPKKEAVFKVMDKKILKHKKMQLNLLYGKTVLTDEKVNTGDSIILKENKIIKILPLEEGREVAIFNGKYKGGKGKLEKIEGKMARVSSEGGKVNVPIKSILVIK
jgi:small subunit ribosomal protein S4e